MITTPNCLPFQKIAKQIAFLSHHKREKYNICKNIILLSVITFTLTLIMSMTFNTSYAQSKFEGLRFNINSDIEELKWQESNFSRWLMSWLMGFYNKEYVRMTDKNIDFSDPPFKVALVNLRTTPRTGNLDIIVIWHDGHYCGAQNCQIDIWLYSKEGNKYYNVSNVIGNDISLGSTSKNGFRDLWLDDKARLRWNGSNFDLK